MDGTDCKSADVACFDVSGAVDRVAGRDIGARERAADLESRDVAAGDPGEIDTGKDGPAAVALAAGDAAVIDTLLILPAADICPEFAPAPPTMPLVMEIEPMFPWISPDSVNRELLTIEPLPAVLPPCKAPFTVTERWWCRRKSGRS